MPTGTDNIHTMQSGGGRKEDTIFQAEWSPCGWLHIGWAPLKGCKNIKLGELRPFPKRVFCCYFRYFFYHERKCTNDHFPWKVGFNWLLDCAYTGSRAFSEWMNKTSLPVLVCTNCLCISELFFLKIFIVYWQIFAFIALSPNICSQ